MTTPADELRAAAEKLRDLAPLITGRLAGLADPVARWLESTAELHEEKLPGHGGVVPPGCQWCEDEDWPCAEMRDALAVARLILGTPP